MYTTDIKYTNILCPVDFSDTSRKAFYTAVGYARAHGAKLTILHVREGTRPNSFDEVESEVAHLRGLF